MKFFLVIACALLSIGYSANLKLELHSIEEDEASKVRGAMVQVSFTGLVGFMLDEIPAAVLSETVAFITNNVSDEQWQERAKYQIKHSIILQIHRGNFAWPNLQLTLPPAHLWKIKFNAAPFQTTVQTHAYVLRNYTFFSVLIGSANSIGASQPELAIIGGSFAEKHLLPADPEHVFQRTGYACAYEIYTLPGGVNSESFWAYFNEHCQAETPLTAQTRSYKTTSRIHQTQFPSVSCTQALESRVGSVSLDMTWKRIAWSDVLAAKYRFGEFKSDVADVEGVESEARDEVSIGYRFFDTESCTVAECGQEATFNGGCVDKPGWRQLYRFTSSLLNVGKTSFVIGEAYSNEYVSHGVLEYDPTAYMFYHRRLEDFYFGDKKTSKVSYNSEFTMRQFNHELVDFSTPFARQRNQGISPGWSKTSVQGGQCQWVDVTDVRAGVKDLSVCVNPNEFYCEGLPVENTFGQQKWTLTAFKTANRTYASKQECLPCKRCADNNLNEFKVDFKGRHQTLVSSACKRRATISPLKDCDFKVVRDNQKCVAGQRVTFTVTNAVSPSATTMIVRVCESSQQLGHTVYCEFVDSLANSVVNADGASINVQFVCPPYRSIREPGGLFSILTSTLIPGRKRTQLRYSDLF